jgi:hypothetical protein
MVYAQKVAASDATYLVPTGQLQKGTYFLQVLDGEGQVLGVEAFVKG